MQYPAVKALSSTSDICQINWKQGVSQVKHLIGHVVHIKTQVTVLVMQPHSSKQQGGLQHQKLLHPLKQPILCQNWLQFPIPCAGKLFLSFQIKDEQALQHVVGIQSAVQEWTTFVTKRDILMYSTVTWWTWFSWAACLTSEGWNSESLPPHNMEYNTMQWKGECTSYVRSSSLSTRSNANRICFTPFSNKESLRSS